jgi:hypothetical protein
MARMSESSPVQVEPIDEALEALPARVSALPGLAGWEPAQNQRLRALTHLRLPLR